MKRRLLKRTVETFISIQGRHPVAILLAAFVLAGLSAFYTFTNLGFHTSQKDLISPKNRLIQLAQQTGQFTQMDSFVVVIESSSPSRSLEFLKTIIPQIQADKQNFQNIFYRIDPESFKPWALFYLDRGDIINITDNLERNADFIQSIAHNSTLVNFFERLNQEMASRMVGELFTGFLDTGGAGEQNKPFDLSFLVRVLDGMQDYLEGDERFVSPWDAFLTTNSFNIDPEEGYFWTNNRHYLLFFVTPCKKAEFTGTWNSLQTLRTDIAVLKNRFPDIRVGVTGPETLNADQMKTSIDDMGKATVISIISLTILFVIFRRGIRIPLLEVTSLLIALSWSFGLTTLLIGHLNILSVTFAPLLLGLGVDFGAHWFARMRDEELSESKSKQDIIKSTLLKIGPAIVLAGLSLSLSFFPLVLTGFKGLVELGLICTFGMIVMAMASLVLLPPLVQIFGKFKRRSLKVTVPPGPALVQPFFKMTKGRALIILFTGTTALGLAAWSATRVHFDLDMLNLQAKNVESVIWEKKLLQGSTISSIYGEILVPNLEELHRKTKQIEALPTVASTESVEALLPKNQQGKTVLFKKLDPLMERLPPIQCSTASVDLDRLESILNRIKFKMDTGSASEWGGNKPLVRQMVEVRELINRLETFFHSPSKARYRLVLARFENAFYCDLNSKLSMLKSNIKSQPMRIEDLPTALRERFISMNNMFIIRIYPKGDIWQPQVLETFVHDIWKISPDAIGDPVTLYVFTQAFRDSCVKAAFYAVILIFIFLLVIFRHLRSTFLALIPLLVGTGWTLGLMPPLGVNLNLANTLFFPLVVGAGVEYGVIVISRWRQKEKMQSRNIPFQTAMGVLLAGLSTMAGFGSLMISSHQGIFSLGLLATVGSITVTAATLLFLPALMYFSEDQNKKV